VPAGARQPSPRLLANAPITTVATYAYANPVVAVFLGRALLSEPVTLTIAAGAAAVLLSVALIVRRRVHDPAD
jgi:drug/metabolite transporter (DMT)-like permease